MDAVPNAFALLSVIPEGDLLLPPAPYDNSNSLSINPISLAA